MCRARLAGYKVPTTILTLAPGEMPRNVNDKVQKHLLMELVAGLTR